MVFLIIFGNDIEDFDENAIAAQAATDPVASSPAAAVNQLAVPAPQGRNRFLERRRRRRRRRHADAAETEPS